MPSKTHLRRVRAARRWLDARVRAAGLVPGTREAEAWHAAELERIADEARRRVAEMRAERAAAAAAALAAARPTPA